MLISLLDKYSIYKVNGKDRPLNEYSTNVGLG